MPDYGQAWQREGQQGGTFVVASDDARNERKNGANFVCDEEEDEEEINAAIAALPS